MRAYASTRKALEYHLTSVLGALNLDAITKCPIGFAVALGNVANENIRHKAVMLAVRNQEIRRLSNRI